MNSSVNHKATPTILIEKRVRFIMPERYPGFNPKLP